MDLNEKQIEVKNDYPLNVLDNEVEHQRDWTKEEEAKAKWKEVHHFASEVERMLTVSSPGWT